MLEVDQNILKRLPPPFEQIRRYVLKRTDVILARSPEAESVVRACGFGGPVLPIGYGVDQDMFPPCNVPSGSTTWTTVAAWLRRAPLRRKGPQDDALEAISLAKCPIDFAIMGEGPYEGRLRQRIDELGLAGRVSIEGWKGLDAVANFFRGLDASLLLSRATPSWKEQFGRTINRVAKLRCARDRLLVRCHSRCHRLWRLDRWRARSHRSC